MNEQMTETRAEEIATGAAEAGSLQPRTPIFLDVDTGVDDALAIMLAVKSGAFDLLGITTVNGNVSLSQATLNTRKVLHVLAEEAEQKGRGEEAELIANIPVIPGADRPLRRPQYFEHRVHGNDGIGGALADLELPPMRASKQAALIMVETIKERPGEVTLIMTGPLTNLALALRACPELPTLVKEVIFMGGVVTSFGNVTPTAEYNIYVDPEAARNVLQAGFNITMVGLDVTRRALLTRDHIESMGDAPLAPLVYDCTRDYMDMYAKRYGHPACAMHDPFAVAVAIDRAVATTEHLYVDVEVNSNLCDGQTVADFQGRWNKEPNVHVCMDLNQEAFIERFLHVLKR
ncbi:nucleoside hydrolase [Paenibacillus sp. SC116]|uniref:nucleoside hydrolase n=1 Tax=Paenibacillus sp. SC116 TaxID=2968986 RepID=UPI00215AD477|nr:nucleoside hydrolase [Paenibacillus sp. SC116]MCR8846756.1 nucleoside hydrolase [Paenibacillus sp. SC116]